MDGPSSGEAIPLTTGPRIPRALLVAGAGAFVSLAALMVGATTGLRTSATYRHVVIAAFAISAISWLVADAFWGVSSPAHAVLNVSGDEFSFREGGRETFWSRSEATLRIFTYRSGASRMGSQIQAAVELTIGKRRVVTIGGGGPFRIPTNAPRGRKPVYIAEYPDWKRLVALLGLPPTG